MSTGIAIRYSNGRTTIDELRILPDSSIWMSGWSIDDDVDAALVIRGGEPCVLKDSYRTYRPDASAALGNAQDFMGFESVHAPAAAAADASLEVYVAGACIHRGSAEPGQGPPHYAKLIDSDQVFHRADIYGSGPPQSSAASEVIAFARLLHGKVLDFGCGTGFLVERMRGWGIDARGIEVDRPVIRTHLLPAVEQYIQLYDGRFPLPFPDNCFEDAIATEVIEHVPDYATAIAELARVTRGKLVITVPDAGAIPRLFHASVVPWHMLEGTHVNFFSSRSLSAVLTKHFRSIRMHKIGLNRTSGIPWCNSLAAVCEK